MSHPQIDNDTSFRFESIPLIDEQDQSIILMLVKATFKVGASHAQEQSPINLSGTFWGDPLNSSYTYEPETAFIKLATDVVLIGHAHALRTNVKDVPVSLQVGPLKKTIRVIGDRVWGKALGKTMMTNPMPFEKIPLIYERAYGGWDRSHSNPEKHTFEPRNPVGTGFRSKIGNFEEGIRLPNLEDPRHPLKSYGDTPPPAGLGFTSPNWQPRAAFAGTYDEQWMKERMPLLPTDFDRRFFSMPPHRD